LVVIANTINIGADIGAMAAAAQLIIPVDIIILMLVFTISILHWRYSPVIGYIQKFLNGWHYHFLPTLLLFHY
jgi:hypothetical protein